MITCWSETLTKMQPRLFLLMYMSQTLFEKHNYDERGTFKIYPILILGHTCYF